MASKSPIVIRSGSAVINVNDVNVLQDVLAAIQAASCQRIASADLGGSSKYSQTSLMASTAEVLQETVANLTPTQCKSLRDVEFILRKKLMPPRLS